MHTCRGAMGVAWLAGVCVAVACVDGAQRQGRIRIGPPADQPAAQQAAPEPTIVSAHFARQDARQLGDLDGILVVFSHEVDPASLVPDVWIVVMKDGRRRVPQRAVLAPANEGDENRTVLLTGDFHGGAAVPSDVVVVGPLYAETGAALAGTTLEVEPFDAPGRVVAAERLAPDEGRCADAAQVVRTYWSDVLRGVQSGDLPRIRVRLGDGSEIQPSQLDDHAVGGDQDADDNVVDLCLQSDVPPRTLLVDEGVFEDAEGHLTAAVEVPIVDLARSD